MQDCFKDIVGLSKRDCDCAFQGRPDAGKEHWVTQAFVAASGDNVLTPEIPLLETVTAENLQVFKNGVIKIPGADYEVIDGNIEIAANAGDYIQIWNLALIPVTEAYKYSTSGLHITDLMPEEELTGLSGCDATMWTMLDEARDAAVREFRAALNMNLKRTRNLKHHTFVGNIGKSHAEGGALPSGKQYAGVHIRTNEIGAGYIKVNRIMTMFSGSGNVTVTVYDQHGQVVSPAFVLKTLAGKQRVNDVNIVLPILSPFADQQHYFIVWEYNEDNVPLRNKTVCSSCSGFSPSRDTANPHFTNKRDKNAWANYLVIGGWTGDSVANFYDAPTTVTEYMNGLSLEVEIGCDLNQGVCKAISNPEYGNWGMSVAVAIQRKAAIILAQKRLASSKANRLTTINQDALKEQVNIWAAEYAEILGEVSKQAPQDVNDCLECPGRIKMQGILS